MPEPEAVHAPEPARAREARSEDRRQAPVDRPGLLRRALGNRGVGDAGSGLVPGLDVLASAGIVRGAPDASELEARSRASGIVLGHPAGVAGPVATRPASASGAPLPQPLLGRLERSLGTDLSTVRLHTDPASAVAVRGAGADAMTVGEDIGVLPERYAPQADAGQRLIAHEVAHVVQQRVTGVRPQFGRTEEAAQPEPVWVSASIAGLRVTSPGRRMPAGQDALLAYLSVVLERIAPTATADQVRVLADRVRGDQESHLTGVISRGLIVPEGEEFAPLTMNPLAFASVADILDQLRVPIALDQQQRLVLRLGLAADRWAADAVAELQQDYPWYTEGIWRAQLSMQTQLLADAVAAEEAAQGAPGGRSGLVRRLRPPLDVLEAVRLDAGSQNLPPGRTYQEKLDRGGQAAMWRLLWGRLPGAAAAPDADPQGQGAPSADARSDPQETMRIRAIQFYWTAPGRYDASALDPEARLDFLRRLWNWFGRSTPALDERRDYTQELIKDPGRYTDDPFPARLEAIPAPVGDLRIVPAHVEHRYRFAVDFSSLFDGFGSYAYRWDVLEWQPEGDDTARAVRAVEGGHTDADTRRTGRHGTRHSDVLVARLERDLAHARADTRRMYSTLGPAGISLTTEAVAVFGLRTLATGARTLIDVLTVERGPGLRERMIQLPGPGLWVIRAVAAPLFDLADEIHRAPSIAYLPVYGMPQEELADRALGEAAAAEDAARENRAWAKVELQDLAGPTADPALRELARELAADPRLGDDRWAALAATQTDLRARLGQLDAAIKDVDGSESSKDEYALLKSQRDAVDRQVTENQKLLDTHDRRVQSYPALATPTSIVAQLVTDDGQTVPLALDWAELDPRSAPRTTRLSARDGSVFGVLSDHTHPGAGIEVGSGRTADDAARQALTTLLESRSGYGRGLLAVRLPSGATEKVRIEASLGSIANETLDDLTTLVTLAALAAAPFTEGASLAILVPVGVVSGVRAAERLYARYDAGTLRWDLQTLQDFVDIATAAVGVGAAVRGAKAGMQVSRIGRIAAVSFDIASNVTGFVILGVRLEDQLREIAKTPGLSDGERRSRRMLAVGGALVAAGMQGGTVLISRAYPQGRPAQEAPVPELRVPELPVPEHPPTPEHSPTPEQPRTPEQPPTPEAVPAVPPSLPPPPPSPPPRPRRVQDLVTHEGFFRPEYPELASAWEAYAERRRAAGQDPLVPREWALSQTSGGSRRVLDALLPPGWRGSGRTVYPGARPEAVALDIGAPRPGTPVGSTGQRWKQRVVRTEELLLRMDPAGDQYWSFPDLKPGEVLLLPNGSRFWLDPQTGEIVDVNPVGPSLGRRGRRVTRGQDAVFGAEDLSQEHVDAGTQRLHGATSPGLGGDAPYSIAAGPPRLNLVLESSGIEKWVRDLRSNAPPGVVYVYTTRTRRSPRGDLIHRTYQIDALEGARRTRIASYDIGMRGVTDADIDVEGWHHDAAALVKYGSPLLREQPKSAPPGGGVRVGIPRTLAEMVGGGDAGDPKPNSPLTAPLQQAQEARARLGELSMRAELSPRTGEGVGEALFELDDAMVRAEERLTTGSLDPEAVQQLAAVTAEINALARIRTRLDRLDVGRLVALARILDRIGIR